MVQAICLFHKSFVPNEKHLDNLGKDLLYKEKRLRGSLNFYCRVKQLCYCTIMRPNGPCNIYKTIHV